MNHVSLSNYPPDEGSLLVLHGAWYDGKLYCWAEAAAAAAVTPTRRRGAKPKVPRPEPHPLDAGGELLLAALAGVGVSPPTAPGPDSLHPHSALIWLPGSGGLPHPSSPLLLDPDRDTAPAPPFTLLPWVVTAFALTPAQFTGLFAASLADGRPPGGVVIGDDLEFWAKAYRFATALTRSGHFLPGLSPAGSGREEARWQPIFVGDATLKLAELTAVMPGAARAIGAASTAAAATATSAAVLAAAEMPATAPAVVLKEFIGRAVDQLVRNSLAGVDLEGSFASLHDRWFGALVQPEATGFQVEGQAKDLALLTEQIRSWQGPLLQIAAAPVRLCFRLEEPELTIYESGGDEGAGALTGEADTELWYVRYLLQDRADPSLLVPITAAWQLDDRDTVLAKLMGRGVDLREYILSALGQAARLCTEVEKSLAAGLPAGFSVDAAGAHRFIAAVAPLLANLGFGVLLPGWWTRRGRSQGLRARARVKSPTLQAGQGLSLDTIMAVDWQAVLGDENISMAELAALAELKSPLVRLRGRWVEVDADEIERALELLQRGQTNITALDAVRLALGAEVPGAPLEVADVVAEGLLKDLLAQLSGRQPFEELAPPAGLQATLRPYQQRGYSWLAFLTQFGLGACLADDMGLGKTIQTLTWLQRRWEAGERLPTLLVCPTSVTGNWQQEARRFTPELPVYVHHGPERDRGHAFIDRAREQALVITTYPLVHRDCETLAQVPWGGIVLDEAQNIKNPDTKQARAVRSLPAHQRIALTGTPVENHVGDLWAIMAFLNPGLLGNQADFRRRFLQPIQFDLNAAATEKLKRLTAPFVLRRMKTDRTVIADLPDKIETTAYCTLTREQASLYAAVVAEAEEVLAAADDDIQRRGLVLATLTRLKQICNHPAQFLQDNSRLAGRSGKLSRLTELCEELLAVGDRALLFTQFAAMGSMLRSYLQHTFGREVLFLHGGTPKARRDEMVRRFQTADGPPLFILSLKAGGTGLNLTRANHVFHFDRWWNPAVENQATDRAFRIGQTRNVQVHKFVCTGTLEEKIDTLIQRKQALAEQIVGGGEAWLTELSTDELKQILALEAGAVAD